MPWSVHLARTGSPHRQASPSGGAFMWIGGVEPTHRDYFKLTTTTGLLVIIYHDLIHDAWFLQRLYD
jgi:hypothetical protein